MKEEIEKLSKLLIAKQWKLASAESCTGGLIAKYCTDMAGSSKWFDRAYITYSNEAKIDMLKVDQEAINKYGAVSQQIVEQMVTGVIKQSKAKAVIAVTGIAGPTGGSIEKPVGTVWVGLGINGEVSSKCIQFLGARENIREQTAESSIEWLIQKIKEIS